MALPTANTGFVGNHNASGDSPDDPNVFTLAEMQAAMGTNSTAISLITSGVASAAASGALNSIPVSTADSKGVSAASNASIADSKAVSDSANISVVDSKVSSSSFNTSIADSKAVSVAVATPTVTAIVYSANISIADSKATSGAATIPTGRSGNLSTYLTNNAVFNLKDYGALGGTTNDTAAALTCMNALSANGGGVFEIPAGSWTFDPPAMVANCRVRGAGKGRTTITAATANGVFSANDVSNASVEDLTFIGLAANGSNNTNRAVFFSATTVDVSDLAVRRCLFKQFKATDACIRVQGNGDLVTPATFFAKRVHVEDCTVIEYYDQNASSLAQAAYGVYFFGGVKEIWAVRNYIDGTSGKHGLIAQSEANDVHFEDNIVVNCGSANAQYGYGITVYSSYTTASVVDATISRNIVKNTAKAGIYVSYAGKYTVSGNTLDTCDVYSAGIGTVGTGAIMINNSADLASNGSGVVANNTIIDPGFCAIYLNTGSFGRSDCVCVGNSLKLTTAVDRTGIVYWGRGAVISGNIMRGFRRGVFLYTTADNIIGDATISDNEFDATGSAANPVGITYNSAFIINPLIISNNRFKACLVGLQIDGVTDITLEGNHFAGCTTGAIVTATRAVVHGNIGDTGTTGLNIKLTAATATARGSVKGNLFSGFTTPYTSTENTGQINVFGNDFGTQPGISADVGDASIATNINEPGFEVFRWSTTLTANRSATIAGTKAIRGASRRKIIRDAGTPGNFTLAVIDGVSSTTLYTIPVNSKGFAEVVFDGTNWKLVNAGTFT